MPFHRQQPATASKLATVYEHEGMSLCVCVELQLDNSTVTRRFNACPSPSRVALLPRQVCEVGKIWNYWWDVDFLLV